MKKKLLKALSLVMAAVALVAITIAGTAAYFTSSSAVTNTFTIGKVGIQLFESYVKADGTIDTSKTPAGSMKNSSGNNYHLQPGGNYVKDPTVYVDAASDKSFLFIKSRNQIATIEAESDHGLMREQMLKNGFVLFETTSTGNVYIFAGSFDENNANNTVDSIEAHFEKDAQGNYVKDINGQRKLIPVKGSSTPVGGVGEMQTIDLFSEFSVTTNEGGTIQFEIYGGAKVTLTAFAIQTTGFVDDADLNVEGAKTAEQKAWNTIVATYPYESGAQSQ